MSNELQVRIGSLTFEHPVMNAAGTVKTLQDVERMAGTTSVAAIMVGSGTVEPRQGNSGKALHYERGFSLNSLGLPNPGMAYYEKNLPQMRRVAEENNKRLVFSAAGFSPQEYAQLAEMAASCAVYVIELNLGCPNVWSQSGEQKPVACFKPDLVREIIDAVGTAWMGLHLWIKVSPFSNPLDLDGFVEALLSTNFSFVEAVTAVNTFANGSAYDEDGKDAIEAAEGFAGISGPALKCVALGHTRKLKKLLPGRSIVGAGGVSTGRDVEDLLHAGASMVQIASAFLRDGVHLNYKIFEQVLTEYTDMLATDN